MNFNQKYAYDGLGRVVSETTAHGLNKTLMIENVNAPVQVSGLYYSITKYFYDDVNRKLDVNVIGNVDNPAYTEDRIKTEYYDYAGNIKKTVDANGNEISYEYNSMGLQRSVTYPGDSSIPTNTVVYKYDSMGNLRYQKDSVGNVKEYKYDLFGRVLSEKVYGTEEEDANETEVRYWYDLYGNVKYKIDANNTVTKYEYDELGRLTRNVVDNVKLIDPATGVDSTTRTSTHETLNYYDKNGNVLHEVTKVTEKDKSKNTTKSSYSVYSYEYDGMGRLVSKIDPVGNIIEKINYNRNSAQIESYDGEDHKKTFEYNKDGKLSVTKQRNESGEYIVSQQYYDARGNVAYVIDGRENITVYNYDEQDNLTGVSSYAKVKEGVYKLTDTTRYIYDKNGNMKSQEINGIVTNTFNYNVRNLVMEKEYPGTSNNIVSYYYYADGNVKEVIDRKNIKTQYKYNPQGLVVEEKAVQIGVNGTEQRFTKKNYEYDSAGNQLKSILTSSTSTEVVERTYDELGRVKTKGVSNVEGKILYIYDIVTSDGLTAETSIDQKNNITTKVYDKAGRLAFVKNGDINAENIAEYDYYKNGAAKSVIYAGGAREDYIYYPDGRLESLVNTDNKGVAFESYVYTYDANGNMLSKEDKKGITTYTYDNLNRLKTVDEKYSGKVTEYTYDKLGNRSTATIKENGIIIEEHVYNYDLELNQLKSVIVRVNGTAVSVTRYEYDANGNQISVDTDGKTTTYAYDEFNQLIEADGAKYGYNAEGYRVCKNVNGSLTRYIYEYDKVVLEIDATGNQVGRNIYGTNLLMRTADGQSYYYMYNGHADVTALINAATGNIDATYYYDAFGNIVESTGVAKDRNSILYAGYQYDKETGLYYLNARMYDPKIARFLQEDTYTGDPEDPLSLNLYTYCANNPLRYYDPDGHLFREIRNGWNWIVSKIRPAEKHDEPTQAIIRNYNPDWADKADDFLENLKDKVLTGTLGFANKFGGEALHRFSVRVFYFDWTTDYSKTPENCRPPVTEEERKKLNETVLRQVLKKGYYWTPDESYERAYNIGEIGGQAFQMYFIGTVGRSLQVGSNLAPWMQNLLINSGAGAISGAITSFGEGKTGQQVLKDSIITGGISGGTGLFFDKVITPAAKLVINQTGSVINGVKNTAIYFADGGPFRPAFATSYSTSVNGWTQFNTAMTKTSAMAGVTGGALGKNILNSTINNIAKPYYKEYDIVPYDNRKYPTPGFEKHHGILNEWAEHNIPGYTKRNAPTILLKKSTHEKTKEVFRNWLEANYGKPVGVSPNWNNISKETAIELTEMMFDAADVPANVRNEYYELFEDFITSIK